MTIVAAMRDPVLFGRFFGPSWSALVVVLKAVFGIAMTEMELAFFGQLSARETGPGGNYREPDSQLSFRIFATSLIAHVTTFAKLRK